MSNKTLPRMRLLKKSMVVALILLLINLGQAWSLQFLAAQMVLTINVWLINLLAYALGFALVLRLWPQRAIFPALATSPVGLSRNQIILDGLFWQGSSSGSSPRPGFLLAQTNSEEQSEASSTKGPALQIKNSTQRNRYGQDDRDSLEAQNGTRLLAPPQTEVPSVLTEMRTACRTILGQSHFGMLFKFDIAEICLFDEASQTLTPLLRWPEAEEAVQAYPAVYRLGQNFTGWIAQQQSVLRIDDVTVAKLAPAEGLDNFPYRAYLGVPLKVEDRFVGTLELASSEANAFGSTEETMLAVIATQTAIVIENARQSGEANLQLQVRLGELAGLQRVSSELNSTLDLNTILKTVIEEGQQVTQADFVTVYFYNAAAETLLAYGERGWYRSEENEALKTLALKQSVVGCTLREGVSTLVANVSGRPDGVSLNPGVQSKIVVPILYGGEPIGAIDLESRQSNFFNDGQLRYVEALANHAAVAISNADAFQQQKAEREQASRRADQLSRISEISNAFRSNRPLYDVLEDITFAIAESVGFDVVLISVVSGQPPSLFHEVGAGIPVAEMEALRQHNQAISLADLAVVFQPRFQIGSAYFVPAESMAVWRNKLSIPYIEKTRSFAQLVPQFAPQILRSGIPKEELWQPGDVLFVPLRGNNEEIIGLLTVENPASDQRPNAVLLQTLETFANQAASAIENAQLFEREQERRRLADTLRGVAELISSSLKIDQLLNLVLQELSKVVKYDHSTVELLEEQRLVIIGGQGWQDYSEQMLGLSFSMMGHNPSRRVVESQEPVIVRNPRAEYPQIFNPPPFNVVESWLGVPLTYGISVLGVITIGSRSPDFFTQEHLEVVQAFANQVAVALQNARLFDEAHQQVRQLEALTEVARSLNEALELEDILNLVLDAVFDLSGHRNGSIWLVDKDTATVKLANTKNVPKFLVEEFNNSNTSVKSEPFASVISSGDIIARQAGLEKELVVDLGLPIPKDVTYVPLRTEIGVIGILAIEGQIRSQTTLSLVKVLADLAAVAIEGARLLADTRTQAAEMQNLYNLGVEISGMLEARQVMQSVISNTLTLMNSQVGLILFWDEQVEQQYLVESIAATPELAEKFGFGQFNTLPTKPDKSQQGKLWLGWLNQMKRSGKLVQWSLTFQKSIWSRPAKDTINLRSISPAEEEAMRLGFKAMLGVPIQVADQIAGAIFVGSTEMGSYGERDVQRLSFVASQAVVAIRNAQLVQNLNQVTESLEQRVVQRTDELANALEDLTEERDRVGVLYQLTSQLARSFDLQEVLYNALNLINTAIGISQGAIMLLDKESGYLVLRAALGRDKPLPPEGIQTSFRVGYGLAGKVMETRTPRLVTDLNHDLDWVAGRSQTERRSAIAVPLSTGDDVAGALLLFHIEPNYFSEEQLRLVAAAGTQIATAVNNAELYRLSTEQADRLQVMFQQQAAEAAKNEAILKSIADGVLVLDSQGNLVLINPKAEEILNIDAFKLEYQPLARMLEHAASPEEAELVRRLYEHLFESLRQIGQGEPAVQFRVRAGAKVVTVALAPVTLDGQDSSSTVAVLRDISREAEIDRLKDEFISSVSHELRTPMTSIKGYTELLLSGNPKIGDLNPTQHRFVSVIQTNVNRLTELVNDILEISRIETNKIQLKLESLDLIELIHEVALSFEGQMVQKSMNLALNLPDQLPLVYADKSRLTQILVNLIGNAWQYTPESGNITVTANKVGRYVQVNVTDSGIGILEQDLQFLFDRFFRSERTEVQVVDGTGLGLSITKSFVEMLGGEIWVKSKVDQGSTFSFTIPIVTSTENP
jgi:GAF domain-containing protein